MTRTATTAWKVDRDQDSESRKLLVKAGQLSELIEVDVQPAPVAEGWDQASFR